jgi:HSP20 family protein
MLRFKDPFDEVDRLLNTFGGGARAGIMPLDAYELDGIYTLRFDVPGVEPDAVDLTVESGMLTVTVERTREETEGATWLLRERPAGMHRREVRLGERLDTGRVDAKYDNGVLTVTIPMREEAKPHKVQIKGGGSERLTSGD